MTSPGSASGDNIGLQLLSTSMLYKRQPPDITSLLLSLDLKTEWTMGGFSYHSSDVFFMICLKVLMFPEEISVMFLRKRQKAFL